MSKQLKLTSGRAQSTCELCGKLFPSKRGNINRFCSIACKGNWQRTQKPVDRDWLYQKYVVEGLDCTAISKIVKRHSKRVWEWLRDYDIPTRERGERNNGHQFVRGQHSAFKGKKHSQETRRKLSEIAKASGRVPFDPAVGPPLKGKRGAEVPTWKGGITPERQSFYSSAEWKSVAKRTWKRDNATCQRCGCRNKAGQRFAFDIHHIVSFAYAPLRAELSNLVLLCEPCHYWVHSAENISSIFIKDIPHG